ncbi:MAG: PQQ-dependent sugar dehydrogenase [Anaerolineae bacterium]|nr:PQQ-dependent sugar dehydrogenase [Anaerolineae bacterium]
MLSNRFWRVTGWLLVCLAAATPLFAFAPSQQSAQGSTSPVFLNAEEVATGFASATGVTNAGDTRLFVTEAAGLIRIVLADGTVLATPFLDISDRVAVGFQGGLLSLAFHPNYTSNGYFYVYYTHENGSQLYSRLSRFTVTADPNIANPASEQIVLTLSQPFGDNNGGDLHFGPDGYLYLSTGDGGDFGDPANNGQRTDTLLGKLLRLDVNGGGNPAECDAAGLYTIPANNPLVDGAGGACDEIWAIGLRNPWRFSFDRSTGDLYIGDVGEFTREEINFAPASSSGGENYGWRCWEGTQPGPVITGCGPAGNYDMPIFDYDHGANGCAVTGGYVYRGTAWPQLQGVYVFADFCSGNFWTISGNPIDGWDVQFQGKILPSFSSPSGFGEGVDGELYVILFDNTATRSLYRITVRPPVFLPLVTRS